MINTWKSSIKGIFVIALVSFISIEIGFRLFFATTVGPSVMLYGTTWHHQSIEDADDGDQGWIAGRQLADAAKQRVSAHENKIGNYSKYFPNQIRYDFDKVTGQRFAVTINGHGFRGPEFVEVKAPDVVRVVTLGASSTFGYYSRDEATYPFVLENLLNQSGCAETKTFEVINLGVPHLRSENILSLFAAEGAPLDADIVTFYEGINDTTRKPGVKGTMQEIAFARRGYQLARAYSLTVKFLDSFLVKPVRDYDQLAVARHIDGKSERFLENVASIRSLAEQNGARFIVATQQAKSLMLERDAIRGVTYAEEAELVRQKLAEQGAINETELSFLTHMAIMTDLRAWTETEDVALVDVIAAMDDRRDHLLSWVHLSPEGNQLIAGVFADEILRGYCTDAISSLPAGH